MRNIRKTLVNYITARDISDDYEHQKQFYRQFITDPIASNFKEQELNSEVRGIKIISSTVPNTMYLAGLACIFAPNPALLMLNIFGEAIRIGSRLIYHKVAKPSNNLLMSSNTLVERMSDDLEKMRLNENDKKGLEKDLDKLKTTLRT